LGRERIARPAMHMIDGSHAIFAFVERLNPDQLLEAKARFAAALEEPDEALADWARQYGGALLVAAEIGTKASLLAQALEKIMALGQRKGSPSFFGDLLQDAVRVAEEALKALNGSLIAHESAKPEMGQEEAPEV
jgi:hypothetical protein